MKQNVDEIVSHIQAKFKTFGGDTYDPDNVVSAALSCKEPVFALGVSVRAVVLEVLRYE